MAADVGAGIAASSAMAERGGAEADRCTGCWRGGESGVVVFVVVRSASRRCWCSSSRRLALYAATSFSTALACAAPDDFLALLKNFMAPSQKLGSSRWRMVPMSSNGLNVAKCVQKQFTIFCPHWAAVCRSGLDSYPFTASSNIASLRAIGVRGLGAAFGPARELVEPPLPWVCCFLVRFCNKSAEPRFMASWRGGRGVWLKSPVQPTPWVVVQLLSKQACHDPRAR